TSRARTTTSGSACRSWAVVSAAVHPHGRCGHEGRKSRSQRAEPEHLSERPKDQRRACLLRTPVDRTRCPECDGTGGCEGWVERIDEWAAVEWTRVWRKCRLCAGSGEVWREVSVRPVKSRVRLRRRGSAGANPRAPR